MTTSSEVRVRPQSMTSQLMMSHSGTSLKGDSSKNLYTQYDQVSGCSFLKLTNQLVAQKFAPEGQVQVLSQAC